MESKVRKFNIGEKVFLKKTIKERLLISSNGSMFSPLGIKEVREHLNGRFSYVPENCSGDIEEDSLVGADNALEYAFGVVAEITKKIVTEYKEVSK